MKTYLLRVLFTLLLISIVLTSYAQSTFSGTGNWSDGARWSNGIPSSTTAVTIASGANCTVNTTAQCLSISYTSNSANSTITISSGSSLTITNGITYTNPSSNNVSQIFNVSDGTATFTNVVMVNPNNTRKNILRINNGTANMSGTFSTPGASGENEIQFTGTGTLKYTSSTTLGIDNNELVEGSGKIEFGRAGNQTLAALTYNNVIISGTGTKIMAAVTIDSMTISSSSTVTWGGVITTINGTLINDGTINFNSITGTKIFVGKVTNNNIWNCSVAVPIEFRGGISNNGTFTPGTGLYTFTTNSQDFDGTQALIFAGAVTVNSPAIINNYDSVLIPSTFTLNSGATWRNQANSQLNLTNTATISGTMNCDGTNNTVYFNLAGDQASPGSAVYVNLSKTNSGILTLGNNTTISGRLLINTGTIAMATNTITVGGSLNGNGTITQADGGILNIGGNNLHSGTHTISTATVNYNGNGNQTIRNLTYNNLGISGSGIKSLNGNTIVSATLTLTAGSLNINGNTLTLNGVISTSSGRIQGSLASKLVIGGSAANANLSFDQTNSTTRSLSNLTSTRALGTTISNALEIVDSINVSNGTITSAGNITLISNADNTARIARIVSGGISGDVIVQRFIPGGAGKRKWRFLSSPVNTGTGITLNQYIDDIHVTGMGGSTNGFDDCSCVPSIRFYNETINAIADSGWRNPSTINHQVNTGFAVEVFVRGSRNTPDPFVGTSIPDNATIDYIGNINSGAININLSYTNNGLTNSDGFNLVGNPYPSQIDWMATGWTKTNIERFFWSYKPDPINPIYGVFDPNSELGTNDVTQYIPSGMGFFVKANNTGAQLGFSESIKSTGAPYNFFKNSTSASSRFPHIRIVAGDALLNDEAILLFDSNANTTATDLSDVMKLFNSTINFYSKSKENKNLALNQISFPSSLKEDTINFSLFVFQDTLIRTGAYNLFLKELVDIPSWLGVDLLDRFNNTRVNLQNNSYGFNIENKPGSHGNNRLAIILYNKTTGIDNQTRQFSLYPNPSQNIINISNYNSSIQKIKIYDMKSALVKDYENVTEILDVSELINGLYFIHIQTLNSVEIHKIIIKK